MEEERPFPYFQLLTIVLLSVVANVILFWIWHTVEFRTLRDAHLKQNDSVSSEIAILEGFVENMGAPTSSQQKEI